jgi:CP family cyanate transporter-like MFS transporter
VLPLAGAAVANVLLPSLVKPHFPERIGPMTGVYATGPQDLGRPAKARSP